ncbi:MAG: ATP-binding protein [Saprospiraceae bacterium]
MNGNDTQQLRAIFETATDCIVILNAKVEILKINQAGERLFAYAKEALLGQKLNALIPDAYQSTQDPYMDHDEATGVAKTIGMGRDVFAQRKDGTVFPCHLSMNEFFVDGEKHFAGLIHDLTERKKSEEKIIQLNQKLKAQVKLKSTNLTSVVNKLLTSNQLLAQEIQERKKVENELLNRAQEIRRALEKEKELNDLKSRFIQMASHEFRTPLSTILSSNGLILRHLENGSSDKAFRHFDRIKTSVNHLTEVLNDFLSLAKIEEGGIEENPREFELVACCKHFIEKTKKLCKDRQKIIADLPNREHPVCLDQKILAQILTNLFSNAIKYSAEGQAIYFTVKVEKHHLEFQVKDEGIGIPLTEQKYLFDKFFRGTNAVNIKGTGLGLNIVKQYVELIDATISLESKEHQGACFTVSIPSSSKLAFNNNSQTAQQ